MINYRGQVPAKPDVELLAVYGTLRRGYRNHHLTLGRTDWLGEGRLPGRLLHIAGPTRSYPYPGYVPDASGTVIVEVLRVADPALWLDLHLLESYLPHDPPSSEYLLVAAEAATLSGEHTGQVLPCLTYVYSQEDGPWPDIPGGDWATVSPQPATGLTPGRPRDHVTGP